jgi:hypothetical protein
MTTISTVTVPTRPCFHCGKGGEVEVLAEDLARYHAGALIQVAFPEMHRALREQLISGTHPECWDQLFGSPELDEEGEEE